MDTLLATKEAEFVDASRSQAHEAGAMNATVVEDYHPLSESLGWELGQLYFDRCNPASSRRRPYLVNNDGYSPEICWWCSSAAGQRGRLRRTIRVWSLARGLVLFARLS